MEGVHGWVVFWMGGGWVVREGEYEDGEGTV